MNDETPARTRPLIIGAVVVVVIALLGLAVWAIAADDDDASEPPESTIEPASTVPESTSPESTSPESTAPGSTAPSATDDIVQLVGGNGNYTTLSSLLDSAGLTTLLSETGPYTLFAPNDDAFAALSEGQLENLETDSALARKVLAYQIVLGTFPTSDLTTGRLTSLEGAPLRITATGSTVLVNTAAVVDPDMIATNGIVQGIDQLLVPPGTDIDPPPPDETTVPATTEAPTTVAAPTTVVPTTSPESPAAPTTGAPPTTEAATTEVPTTEAPATTSVPGGESLYYALSDSPEYSLYLELVDAAGLTDRLSDPANAVTLFAPTNGAFGADEETQDANMQRLLELPQEDLVAIVAYHAVVDVLTIDQLVPGDELPTLSDGQTLAVVEDELGFIQIKGAQNVRAATIVDPDRPAGTSIVQGVDKLLIPDGVVRPEQSPQEPDDRDDADDA